MNRTKEEKGSFCFTNPVMVVVMALIYNFISACAYPMLHIGHEAFHVSSQDIGGILLFGGWRTLLGGMVILLVAIVKQRKIPFLQKDMIFQVLMVGFVLQFLQFFFCYIGLANTSSSKGSILYGLSTYFSIILAHFVYKSDALTGRKILGCLLGFFSIIIYNFNGLQSDWGFTLLGDGALLLSAIFYAIGNNMNKKVVEKGDTMVIAAYQMIFGGLLLVISGKLFGGHFEKIETVGYVTFTYLFVTLGLTFWLFSQLLKYNSLGRVTIFNALMPIFGTIASALLLKEDIGKANILLAMFLAVLGIFLVNGDWKIGNKGHLTKRKI